MTKLRAFLFFLPLAVIAAGLFGAFHDQISYTVSSEYFTRFKFVQFRLLDSPLPERLRAAEVGFLASWWMGLPLGVLVGVAGFIQSSGRRMWHALLWSLALAMAVTLSMALAGLGYGVVRTTEVHVEDYRDWYLPSGLRNLAAFLQAGYMHNAAYLGGVVAVPVAWAFQVVYWWRRRGVA